MKIDYVLIGSNEDPMYLDFWPIVSKVWREKFNIVPVLGLITNEKEEITNDQYGMIVKLKNIDGYNSGLLSQLVRLFLPKYVNGNCIISDIDMIPLSKKYFIDDIKQYDENDFIILSSHHPQTIKINQYPMCYVIGNSKLFNDLFDFNDDWENFIKKIPNNGWYTDQLFLYEKIKNNKNINFNFPEREGGFFKNRIDRINWVYKVDDVISGKYIDSHLLRPYKKYKREIDNLINLI